jgi:hypothetical protein
MMAVDIGDCRLCLEIPTGRGIRVPGRWRCVQAWDRRHDDRRRAARDTLKYVDNETDAPTVPDIRADNRFCISCSTSG